MDGGEGHFAVRLRKNGAEMSVPEVRNNPSKLPDFAEDFIGECFRDKPFGESFELRDNKIYAFDKPLPDTRSLSILRKGVILGEVKKNRVEPHHCAFMALKPEECTSFIDLDTDSEDIRKFLHGEELSVSADLKGYTAVCVNGITVGFGKASNGKLKNKYPKGLRTL